MHITCIILQETQGTRKGVLTSTNTKGDSPGGRMLDPSPSVSKTRQLSREQPLLQKLLEESRLTSMPFNKMKINYRPRGLPLIERSATKAQRRCTTIRIPTLVVLKGYDKVTRNLATKRVLLISTAVCTRTAMRESKDN